MTLAKRTCLTIDFLMIKFCRHGNLCCAENIPATGLA